ncbi:MAG: Ig-like domain-containing protein [Bacteroidota bacterium]
MTQYRFPFFLFLLATWSCANQTQPTGGPKDEDPPELIESDPVQGAINVSANKVELTFNEFIKTENPKEQLIISPRVNIEFDIKYRKNKAFITFEEDLPDSTTFTFNFREAIVDITESNPPENLKLAFSSGTYLDSLSISGNVKFHLSDKVVENATVALYQVDDTLDIFTGPPLYFTKTDENGDYTFDNLKSTTYKIYAFQDDNKNLITESKSESYGFKSGIIQLDSSIANINIPLLHLDVRPLELQSYRQSGTTYNIKYNKPLLDYQLLPNSDDQIISSFSDEEQSNIQIYNTFTIRDSLQLFITAQDSLNQIAQDTVYLKFEPTQRKPVDLDQQFTLEKVIIEERLIQGSLNFNKPIVAINFDSIYVYIDSTHVYSLDSSHFFWSKDHRSLEYLYLLDKQLFDKKEKEKSEPNQRSKVALDSTSTKNDSTYIPPPKPDLKPHIRFASASFITAELDSSSNIKTDLAFTASDQLGLIALQINTDRPSFIIQLLDNQDNIVNERINETQFDFKYVTPGTYRIRILVDQDQNGVWNSGNILLDIEPEPVLFYEQSTSEQTITIRANFEIAPDAIEF